MIKLAKANFSVGLCGYLVSHKLVVIVQTVSSVSFITIKFKYSILSFINMLGKLCYRVNEGTVAFAV